MAVPTQEALRDMLLHGVGVQMLTDSMFAHIPLSDFFYMPEPGERYPWPSDRIFFGTEPYDDGGGAAIAAYQFGRCTFL